MRIIPEEYRVEFENKVDWLKDKACARRKGLGTRLPFDKEWLIESLGDSTIYMSYYIIARFIEKGDLKLWNSLPFHSSTISCLEKAIPQQFLRILALSPELLDEIRSAFQLLVSG